ncbi:heme NO-binding protein [Sphingobacteriales bacterium UPWRP_1]|nr:heme NO-binding protein [Sphingobacteriales bacterium TSM_CSM]PSJ74379.1 heme NO-binding protein [Sphingobacteriales bacterium UPWRP_1]
MYGIVNKAIEDLVKINYGIEAWENIKEKSRTEIDFFISNEPYPDEVTYKLAIAAAEELSITVEQVLIAFGEFWVLHTGKEKYGSLMEAGGNNLKEFLINLPNFHNRIMLIYPNLTPPEFRISHLTDNSLHVHYFSQRPGLKEFVRGLLQGLGKLYQTEVAIELLQCRDEGADHEIFKVNW